MSTVSVAVCTTRHFQFIATGATPQAAVDALLDAWRVHCGQTGADLSYVAADDVNVLTGPVGTGFRDGERVTGQAIERFPNVQEGQRP